jgi:hypothetical protein
MRKDFHQRQRVLKETKNSYTCIKKIWQALTGKRNNRSSESGTDEPEEFRFT